MRFRVGCLFEQDRLEHINTSRKGSKTGREYKDTKTLEDNWVRGSRLGAKIEGGFQTEPHQQTVYIIWIKPKTGLFGISSVFESGSQQITKGHQLKFKKQKSFLNIESKNSVNQRDLSEIQGFPLLF